MVKFWEKELDKAILRTKRRIQIGEVHAIGKMAMEEKEILKKQLKRREDNKL